MSISWGRYLKTHRLLSFSRDCSQQVVFFRHCKLNCIIIRNLVYFVGNCHSWCWIFGSSFNLVHNFFRFTFAGVAFVIMGTFCFYDSFVFSFQDCGIFQLIIFCATPVDTVISWLFLIIWVAVVKCNFSASVWFYNLNLHFGTSDRCCYWNTEWLKIFTQFRLRLGANCVNFLSSVCKLLNPVTTTLLYSNLILIITFKKD